MASTTLNRTCEVADCTRTIHGHDMCLMHYKRVKKHGTTEKHQWQARSGFTVPDDVKEKIRSTLSGRKLDTLHRQHIAEGMKGKVKSGQENHMWHDDLTYAGVHAWVRRTLGTPSVCENCNVTSGVMFDWANLSYEYKRDESDWARLCRRCHFLIDGVGLYMRTNKAGIQ